MEKQKKYHFIGIGGIGMSGIAKILLAEKQLVSGSDLSTSEITIALEKLGAHVFKGHSEKNITPDMTIVYNSQINPDNPEFKAAIQYQCPILHRSDLLNELMQKQKVLAVAGTHGKQQQPLF